MSPPFGKNMNRVVGRKPKPAGAQKSVEVVEFESGLQRLAAVATHGVVALRDGCVVWANEKLTRMLGCELEALIGERFADWLPDGGLKLPDTTSTRSIECQLRREGGATQCPLFLTRYAARLAWLGENKE